MDYPYKEKGKKNIAVILYFPFIRPWTIGQGFVDPEIEAAGVSYTIPLINCSSTQKWDKKMIYYLKNSLA